MSFARRHRVVALICALAVVVPVAVAPSAALGAAREPSLKHEFFLEKTRFVTDVGLAIGALRQWVYKPYRDGKFASGASGRTAAFVKAGLATAFAANRLNAAYKLAQKDNTLKKLIAPLTLLRTKIGQLVTRVKGGNVGSGQLGDLNGVIDSLTSSGATNGVSISPKTVSSALLGG
jgi:hypothetical protein